LSASPLSWGAYYARQGESDISLSSFGIRGTIPVLASKSVHEALLSGIIRFNNEESKIFQIFDGHCFIVPQRIQLPVHIVEKLREISALSPLSNGKFRLYPPEKYSDTSIREFIRLGLSRNFLFASFFMINASSLIQNSVTRCPHADKNAIGDELRGYAITVLGSSGHALSIKNDTCFCVFYSHAAVDAELVATQVTRTISRALFLEEKNTLTVDKYFSAKLTDDATESAVRSFIDDL